MDPDKINEFRDVIHQLQSSENIDEYKVLQHANFQGINLTLVPNGKNGVFERFSRVVDITGIDYPVILACRTKGFWNKPEKHTNESLHFVQERKKKSTSSSVSSVDRSSIEGSPLKLDIIADLSLIDESVVVVPRSKQLFLDFGMTHTEARQIVSLYSNYFTSSKDDSVFESGSKPPAMIALCDGKNHKSVSCLSMEPVIDKENNLKGMKVTNVMAKPSAVKSEHMKLKPKLSMSEYLCKAKYDILTKSDDASPEDLQSSLWLELEWRRLIGHSVILLHDPPLEAKARVKVQVTSGSTRSQAFGLYQELEILRAIIQSLETSEVNWIGMHEQPLVESVKDLVEQLKLGSDIVQYNFGETSLDDDCNPGFESLLLEERKDLDFTDHLWKILLNCTSYTELVEAFNYVVSALRQGDLRPFIHSYNSTSVARMVKDSYQGQLRMVYLSGLCPLEYLAEMGLQKLLHDYIHIFLSRSLLTLSQLEYYMKGNLTLQEKFERLVRLHNTLEIVIIMKQYLHLTKPTLCESARLMLKHYESNGVDPGHHFTFIVPTSLLTNIIQTYAVSDWRIKCVKMIEGVPQHQVYQFTAEQPFDWIREEQKVNATRGSSGDVEEAVYYLTVLQDSVSILS